MRKEILSLTGVILLGTSSLFAQPQSILPKVTIETKEPGRVPDLPALEMPMRSDPACGPLFWARGEYLLWWVKNAQLPVPIVSTGDPNVGFPLNNGLAGAIGQPSTQVLLGGNGANLGTFSGFRLTLGGWLDNNRTVGIEGSGFSLEKRTSRFYVGSDAAGNPPVYIPEFNPIAGAEHGAVIADPLQGFSGSVSVTSTLQLWGAEVNGLINLWRRPGLEFSVLGGFRYAELKETLAINSTTNDLIFLNTAVFSDQFATRNQFYGGQFGGRMSYQQDRLSVDVTTKVALGATHQVVDIQGNSSLTVPPGGFPLAPIASTPGGIFTQPSNIGRRTGNEFSVMPTVELKLGYQITPRMRVFTGYDFMYWNQVVRPGNQMDHNLNLTQSPIFGGGALVGPAVPAPLFQRTDFWAHGVTFGFEFRF